MAAVAMHQRAMATVCEHTSVQGTVVVLQLAQGQRIALGGRPLGSMGLAPTASHSCTSIRAFC